MLASRILETLRKRKAILILSLVVIIALGLAFELDFIQYLLLLTFVVIFGWLVSLPLWFLLRFRPSLRTSAQANRRIRWTMIGIVSLLGLSTLFVVGTYIFIFMEVVFYPIQVINAHSFPGQDSYNPESQSPYEIRSGIVSSHGNLMVKELWLRQISLPPLRKSCYSTNQVCGLVEDIAVERHSEHPYPNWADYMTTIAISFLLSFPATLFAWFYTRPPKDKRRVDQPKQLSA